MNRNLFILAASCALFISSSAYGGYDDLMKEIETYAPPSYSESHKRSAPADKTKSVKDRAFKAEKARIQKTKDLWNRSLSAEKEETSFVRVHTKRMKTLRPAASDDGLAVRVIRKEFSPETLETLVLLRNPGIKAEEHKLRAAIETFSQVSHLDEILRQYTAYTEGLMTGIGPMKAKDSIKMKFPFPGILALKGEIVNQEVIAARERLEIARREAITAARKTYWNLIFIRKSQKITSETVELFRQLESVATTRYNAGNTTFQDVAKVDIQREILEEELRTLKEIRRNLESKILELLNLSPGVKLGSPKLLEPLGKTPSLKSLYAPARETRQELRQMRAMIGKMERMTEMAETMILPSYTLNFSLYDDEAVMKVGSAAMKESFPVSAEASGGAGLPKMPWYGTNDAYLRQTRQKLEGLRQDLRKAESVTSTMIRNAWFELDKAKREAALYRDRVVGLSRSALDVSTRAYESGNIPFADVIGSYTNWLKVRLTLERKRSDIGVARAELERVVGTSLE